MIYPVVVGAIEHVINKASSTKNYPNLSEPEELTLW